MLLSYTENAIVRGDFKKAWDILSNVTSYDASSDGDKLVRIKNTSIGRVEQYSMKFESAQHYFNICLDAAGQANNPGRYHVIHHIADIYCEQHKPEEAVRLTSNEYLDLKTQGEQRLRTYRRLGLSLLEA